MGDGLEGHLVSLTKGTHRLHLTAGNAVKLLTFGNETDVNANDTLCDVVVTSAIGARAQ